VFVIGGSNQKVERYEEIAMMSPYLIFALSNAVHQLIYSQDGKYLAISSEENVLTIYNQDLSLNSKCRPSHDGMTLSAAFDPKERFVASIGCDGSANIFQLA
jgi:chromosome transmission fidelity protein 4